MKDPVARKATYQDLLRVPDHLVAELIRGHTITHPRPAPHHARTASSLGIEVGGPFDKEREAWEAGGFWTSRSFISTSMCWCRTSPDGAASVCPPCRTPPGSRSGPTRCVLRPSMQWRLS